MLSAGVELMLVGMGTVFSFLTLLVLATSAMSRILQRVFPPRTDADDVAGLREEEIAAIAVAIQLHQRVS
jgi:oxaloacetate decarboxylase gamma subunit